MFDYVYMRPIALCSRDQSLMAIIGAYIPDGSRPEDDDEFNRLMMQLSSDLDTMCGKMGISGKLWLPAKPGDRVRGINLLEEGAERANVMVHCAVISADEYTGDWEEYVEEGQHGLVVPSRITLAFPAGQSLYDVIADHEDRSSELLPMICREDSTFAGIPLLVNDVPVNPGYERLKHMMGSLATTYVTVKLG